jgi:F-type H+-transporting ATPase subunit epsilon
MASDLPKDKIQLEIVTPKGRALTASVDEVTAPSVDGDFGVMPGHLPLLAALRTGIVTYREGPGDPKKCAVGAGFAEAGANKLVILTDDYIERDQIDPVIVRKELAEVQGAIEKAVTKAGVGGPSVDPEAKLLIAKENWLAAQLELYGDPPPATMRLYESYGPPPPPADDEVPNAAGEDAGSHR